MSNYQIIQKSPEEHAEVMKNLLDHANRYSDSHQRLLNASFTLYILGIILMIAIPIICPLIGKQLTKPISVEPIVSLPIVVGSVCALSFAIGVILHLHSLVKRDEQLKMVGHRRFLYIHFLKSKGYEAPSKEVHDKLVEILNQFEEPDIQKKRALLMNGFGERAGYSALPKELRGLIAEHYANPA